MGGVVVNKEQAKRFIPILEAFCEGKNVQFISDGIYYTRPFPDSISLKSIEGFIKDKLEVIINDGGIL